MVRHHKWGYPEINGGTLKSSILIVCSLIHHPFGGTAIFGNHTVHRRAAHPLNSLGANIAALLAE